MFTVKKNKMKKILLFGGIAIAGFGLYRYFKYQIDMALNYDYKLKNFKVLGQEGDIMKVSATFEISNKSAFKVDVTGYELELFFKDISFAVTKSTDKITIQPNSSFEIVGYGEINVKTSKIIILPFIKDVLDRKPIDISVSGVVRIVFLGVPTTLKFDKQKFNYSVDLLQEYNLDSAYERLKAKYPKVFYFLGIK
jgi:LEA14-like dessication related protein